MTAPPLRIAAACAAITLLPAAPADAQPPPAAWIACHPAEVVLTWQPSHPPYLVETSPDLAAWGDRGDLLDFAAATLAAHRAAAFYRVRHLNPADELGPFYGLIQTDQGEGWAPLGRHRLKSRWWLYRPQGATSPVPATFFRQLRVFYQHRAGGRVATFAGRLEELGAIASPKADVLAVSWADGAGAERRDFTLTLDFPYDVSTPRAIEPLPSDPYYTLDCRYATPQPELEDWSMTISPTTTDQAELVQLAPPEAILKALGMPQPQRDYSVTAGGLTVTHSYLEGLPLYQGQVGGIMILTWMLDHWTAPTTVAGAQLPAFATDSHFARTLLPHHHNFAESALVEPALDPALAEATLAGLRAANVRYVYTTKDLMLGLNSDAIYLIGFDDSVRQLPATGNDATPR